MTELQFVEFASRLAEKMVEQRERGFAAADAAKKTLLRCAFGNKYPWVQSWAATGTKVVTKEGW